MQNKFFIYYISFFLCILNYSCSKEENLTKTKEQQGTPDNNASIYSVNGATFSKSLKIDIPVSSIGTDSNQIVLLYYRIEKEGKEIWSPLSGFAPDKSYVTNYYINQKETGNGYILEVEALKPDINEPYQDQISFKEIKIVSVTNNSVKNLSPQILNFQDYKAVQKHFNLED